MSARRHLLAVVTVASLAACGFPTEDSPTPIGDEQTTTVSTPGTGSVVETGTATTWFIRADVLVSRVRDVPLPITAEAVMATLGAGVTPAETNSGLRSAIPDAEMLLAADLARGTATVELAPGFLDVAPGDQVLALGQVVLTLTDLPGVGRVRFQINGVAVAVPLPDGTSSDDSVSREDFAPLTSGA
jgi:spore germination protein GerM